MKKSKENKSKQTKQKSNKKNAVAVNVFKQKYFEYYDDVKDYTKGKEDW